MHNPLLQSLQWKFLPLINELLEPNKYDLVTKFKMRKELMHMYSIHEKAFLLK